jgi:hypothetical protein
LAGVKAARGIKKIRELVVPILDAEGGERGGEERRGEGRGERKEGRRKRGEGSTSQAGIRGFSSCKSKSG